MAKKDDKKKPKVHKDLGEFEFKINELGKVSTNLDIDSINEFLNKNVEDKKLKKDDDSKSKE